MVLEMGLIRSSARNYAGTMAGTNIYGYRCGYRAFLRFGFFAHPESAEATGQWSLRLLRFAFGALSA